MRDTVRADDHVIVPAMTATDRMSPTAMVGIFTCRMSVGSFTGYTFVNSLLGLRLLIVSNRASTVLLRYEWALLI